MSKQKPDKNLLAVCGLFCPSCAIYIASTQDDQKLEEQAKFLNLTKEETGCYGCRTDKRNKNCANCFMSACAKEKGVDFCNECEQYPCDEFKKFQAILPHRLELQKDLENIKQVGCEMHFTESIDNYSCAKCNTINTGWDLQCRNCGHEPSCKYVENNKEEIIKRLQN